MDLFLLGMIFCTVLEGGSRCYTEPMPHIEVDRVKCTLRESHRERSFSIPGSPWCHVQVGASQWVSCFALSLPFFRKCVCVDATTKSPG